LSKQTVDVEEMMVTVTPTLSFRRCPVSHAQARFECLFPRTLLAGR